MKHLSRFLINKHITRTQENAVSHPRAPWNKEAWVGRLVGTALWDSISVNIWPSPREREKEKRDDRREKICPNNHHPHLLQVQKALALLYSKLVGRPGTGSLPSNIAPPDHPQEAWVLLTEPHQQTRQKFTLPTVMTVEKHFLLYLLMNNANYMARQCWKTGRLR